MRGIPRLRGHSALTGLCLALWACNVFATDSGFLAAVSVGRTDVRVREERPSGPAPIFELNKLSTRSVSIGYRFEWFDAQAAYRDFGETEFRASIPTGRLIVTTSDRTNGTLGAKGFKFWLSKAAAIGRWEIFGNLGMDNSRWSVTGTRTIADIRTPFTVLSVTPIDVRSKTSSFLLGAGVRCLLGQHLTVQLSAELLPMKEELELVPRYELKVQPLSMEFGLTYRIGKSRDK